MNNNIKIGTSIVIFIIIFLSLHAYAKDTSSNNRDQLDFSIGYGYGHFKGIFTSDPFYRPVTFMLHYAKPVDKTIPFLPKILSNRWMFYLEPGFSILSNKSSKWEAGTGIGLKYMLDLSKNVQGYFLVGSGLIYITYKSHYQDTNFNFQNNIGTGLLFFISKNKALDVGIRYRHISNAGIRKPNDGIDNLIGTIGLSLFF